MYIYIHTYTERERVMFGLVLIPPNPALHNRAGALFGKDSMIVFENPLGKCGAYASSCHSFLDEIGDALKATPQVC
jgi:hypothetical protein